jgi:EAL domain-containing protein (putative c-di-GMP-specific phosphodiesterase class I)
VPGGCIDGTRLAIWSDVRDVVSSNRQQMLVLVVDDDASVLRALGRTLRRRGYDVATASSVAAAREQLDGLDVDIVLSDIGLGDGSGHDVASAARLRHPDLPVLFFSGTPALVSGELGRCLTKPLDEADLLDAIASARPRPADDLLGPAPMAELDDALATAHLAVQPVVRWSAGAAVGHELLLRSSHARLGRPERLLAAAAEHGRLLELSRTVRAQAADRIAGLPDGDVYLNLHPAELDDETLFDARAPLAAHAGRVVLDLSERATWDRFGVEQRVARLRSLGFRIALDDISDGGGGLGLLAVLRPDALKIDGALIHGVRRDPVRRAVVRGLFALGARMGALTIAEGVESEDDLLGVVEAGGDHVAGFLFGRPSATTAPLELAELQRRLAR